MGSHTVAQFAHDHGEGGAKHFNSSSYFVCLVCRHCTHIFSFYYTKAIL